MLYKIVLMKNCTSFNSGGISNSRTSPTQPSREDKSCVEDLILQSCREHREHTQVPSRRTKSRKTILEVRRENERCDCLYCSSEVSKGEILGVWLLNQVSKLLMPDLANIYIVVRKLSKVFCGKIKETIFLGHEYS